MPIITTSVIMAFKGALFLAKSAAVKGAVLKYGSYMLATKGVVATASAGLTVATAAGVFVTVKSIPERTMKGFTQIVNGMSNGSSADFMDGLYQLARAYSSANSLLADFDKLVDASDCNTEVKISLKKSLKSMKPILEDEIEKKSYALLKEIEEHLKSRGMSASDYSNRVRSIYIKHTFDLSDNYSELLGRGGRIYADISSLNESLSISSNRDYDHYLAYCIAGWIKDNLQLSCISYKSQKELAGDITDQIFAYLRAYNL